MKSITALAVFTAATTFTLGGLAEDAALENLKNEAEKSEEKSKPVEIITPVEEASPSEETKPVAKPAKAPNPIEKAKQTVAQADKVTKEADATVEAAKPASEEKPDKDVARPPEEAAKPAEAVKPAAEQKPEEPVKPTEVTPARQEVTPKPVADAPAKPGKTDEGAAIKDADTDEIDLEESDDSAEAAKKTTVLQNKDNQQFFDISCDDATLTDILRQFRRTTSANIISDDSTNLAQRVSVNLVHVPWLKGLEAILGMKNFRLEEHDGIFRVVEDHQKIPISTRTFTLNHASAAELATLFNKSYGLPGPNGKKTEIATAFDSANTVVITATDKQLAECEAIIKAVDKSVAQIYIEARFLEISRDAMHKLGVDWSSLSSWGAGVHNIRGSLDLGRSKTITVNNNGSITLSGERGKNSSNTASAESPGSASIVSSSGKTSSSTRSDSGTGSRQNNDVGTLEGAFGGTLSIDDFRLALSAFEQAGGEQIFSKPKVIVSNGKKAQIDMTTKYPNITITSQRSNNNGASYTDYAAKLEQIQGDKADPKNGIAGGLFAGSCFFEWGITLTVKPRISPDGLISVEIVPTISELADYYSVGGSSAGDQNAAYGNYPIIDMKTISTEFTMKDGSTAVIGGLSRTVETDKDTGIPFLHKIPWIGQTLFGWKSRVKEQKEIIVCVTLGIANPANLPKDLGLPTNAILGREYINGIRLEPGFREGPSARALQLDHRTLEEIQNDTLPVKQDIKQGEVLITPSKQ